MKSYLSDYLFVLGDARRLLPVLIGMMLTVAVLDLFSLGLITPLIVAFTATDKAQVPILPALTSRLAAFDIKIVAVLVLVIFTAKALVGYRIQKGMARFSEFQRSHLMNRLMASYLDKPYEYHLQRNSAEIVNTIVYTTYTYATGTLATSLRLLTDVAMFVAIVGFLLWVDWSVVSIIGILMVVVVVFYNRIVKSRLASAGQDVTDSSAMTVRAVNQGISGIREIRILGVEQFCLGQLRASTTRMAEGNASYGALSAVPRYLMEWNLVMALIVLALLVSTRQIQSSTIVPVMGLFGVAAIRLMPGVTTIISSLNSLRMNRYGLHQLAEDLRQLSSDDTKSLAGVKTASPTRPSSDFRELRFDGVTYRYAGTLRAAIDDVSFTIRAGQAIGLMGRSGSGKSTTADVLLGLLAPHRGVVFVNGEDIHKDIRTWMNRVAYIPQQIHLSDDTLSNNIAFGIGSDAIDKVRVEGAIRAARLEELIAQLPRGLNTVIGERGVRLSGGQRQRVALARAFYHDRDVIVMDEATASLDHETEQEVVAAIRNLHGKKTLIIIAHRLSTLEGCDTVIRLEDGRVAEIGDYRSVVQKKSEMVSESTSIPVKD